MENKIIQIGRLFADSEQAATLLNSANTVNEVVDILGQYGVELTEDEFIQIGKEIVNNELSEEMLDMVVGGGKFAAACAKAWQAVKDFVRGFLDAF